MQEAQRGQNRSAAGRRQQTQGKLEGIRQIVRVALTPWRPRFHVLRPLITLSIRHDFIRREGECPVFLTTEK